MEFYVVIKYIVDVYGHRKMSTKWYVKKYIYIHTSPMFALKLHMSISLYVYMHREKKDIHQVVTGVTSGK